MAASSGLRSANAGGSSQDVANVSNAAGASNIVSTTQKEQMAENRKLGSFPSDLSTMKPIFSLKSKS